MGHKTCFFLHPSIFQSSFFQSFELFYKQHVSILLWCRKLKTLALANQSLLLMSLATTSLRQLIPLQHGHLTISHEHDRAEPVLVFLGRVKTCKDDIVDHWFRHESQGTTCERKKKTKMKVNKKIRDIEKHHHLI